MREIQVPDPEGEARGGVECVCGFDADCAAGVEDWGPFVVEFPFLEDVVRM